MTCIVAVRSGRRIYLGGDSAGVNGLNVTEIKNPKVFRNREYFIGYTSSFRMGQLLEHSRLPDYEGEDPYKFMCTVFVDYVQSLFCDHKYGTIKEGENANGGTFIVILEDRIFMVEDDFQVFEPADSFCSVGCGVYYAQGSLLNSSHLGGSQRVIQALKTASYFSGGVRAPFTVLEKAIGTD